MLNFMKTQSWKFSILTGSTVHNFFYDFVTSLMVININMSMHYLKKDLHTNSHLYEQSGFFLK